MKSLWANGQNITHSTLFLAPDPPYVLAIAAHSSLWTVRTL